MKTYTEIINTLPLVKKKTKGMKPIKIYVTNDLSSAYPHNQAYNHNQTPVPPPTGHFPTPPSLEPRTGKQWFSLATQQPSLLNPLLCLFNQNAHQQYKYSGSNVTALCCTIKPLTCKVGGGGGSTPRGGFFSIGLRGLVHPGVGWVPASRGPQHPGEGEEGVWYTQDAMLHSSSPYGYLLSR